MAVINAPFESQYGFKGPGFVVDQFGNITATSIVTSSQDDPSVVSYTITQIGNEFFFSDIVGSNPTITLSRAASYTFGLTNLEVGFYIYSIVPSEQYSIGLTHSDGLSGVDAQGKLSGTLTFNVSLDSPDTLYYGDESGNIFGTINLVDPIGQFSTVDINSTAASTSSLTGALTVAGGAGIKGDLYIGGSLNIDGVGIQTIISPTNLELEATNNIVIKIDGVSLGVIKSTGSTVPVVDTIINNTVIGATTPAAAAFTSATVATLPTSDNSVTNRQYVDSTALSLAIAFGL